MQQNQTFSNLSMSKLVIWVVLLALFFAAGVWVTRSYYASTAIKSEEQAQVLLERVKTVCKLIAVEGYFSEVYDYKDYWGYDWSPFRKKALVRIKAKVSVGYDMENMQVTTDAATKTLRISKLPAPTILSIDHELDYYDITEGSFNAFTPEDYNRLNAKAKAYIEEQANKSNLFENATKQGNQTIETLRMLAEAAGWKLEITANAPQTPIQ